jgi:hypothetical protein
MDGLVGIATDAGVEARTEIGMCEIETTAARFAALKEDDFKHYNQNDNDVAKMAPKTASMPRPARPRICGGSKR